MVPARTGESEPRRVTSPRTPQSPGRTAPRRAATAAACTLAATAAACTLAGLVLAGCTVLEPGPAPALRNPSGMATTPGSFVPAETPAPQTHAPVAAAQGPCHELTEDRVHFDTDDAGRVLFATAADREVTEVTLTSCLRTEDGYAQEWTAPGRIGAGGFGPAEATEVNTLQTPTGSYTMTEGFGRRDPGTALEYHPLTPESRWGGRGDSPYFNEYFEGPGAWPDENLWDLMQGGLYEQAVVINFNRPPDAMARPGLSFAIFLHAGLTESWGCVSTDLDTVTRVLRDATPGDRIVMGAEDDVFRRASSPPSAS